jgi:hypothetical protein
VCGRGTEKDRKTTTHREYILFYNTNGRTEQSQRNNEKKTGDSAIGPDQEQNG